MKVGSKVVLGLVWAEVLRVARRWSGCGSDGVVRDRKSGERWLCRHFGGPEIAVAVAGGWRGRCCLRNIPSPVTPG
jgi:hypothetical protein